jgi:hypothetical protein
MLLLLSCCYWLPALAGFPTFSASLLMRMLLLVPHLLLESSLLQVCLQLLVMLLEFYCC